jgi:hypothetical protein
METLIAVIQGRYDLLMKRSNVSKMRVVHRRGSPPKS